MPEKERPTRLREVKEMRKCLNKCLRKKKRVMFDKMYRIMFDEKGAG